MTYSYSRVHDVEEMVSATNPSWHEQRFRGLAGVVAMSAGHDHINDFCGLHDERVAVQRGVGGIQHVGQERVASPGECGSPTPPTCIPTKCSITWNDCTRST